MNNTDDLKKLFPIDSWVMWKQDGIERFSEVFMGWEGTYEPFTQLNNFNPEDYTIVSNEDMKGLINE